MHGERSALSPLQPLAQQCLRQLLACFDSWAVMPIATRDARAQQHAEAAAAHGSADLLTLSPCCCAQQWLASVQALAELSMPVATPQQAPAQEDVLPHISPQSSGHSALAFVSPTLTGAPSHSSVGASAETSGSSLGDDSTSTGQSTSRGTSERSGLSAVPSDQRVSNAPRGVWHVARQVRWLIAGRQARQTRRHVRRHLYSHHLPDAVLLGRHCVYDIEDEHQGRAPHLQSGQQSPLHQSAASPSAPSACAICQERLVPSSLAKACVPCGHVFHGACIGRLVATNGRERATCPLCNQQFAAEQVINIFV